MIIMEITRCVFGERSEPTLSPITVCTRRVGPLANTITVRRTGHTDGTVHAVKELTRYT